MKDRYKKYFFHRSLCIINVELSRKRYFKAFLLSIKVLLAAFHIFSRSVVRQPNWFSHEVSLGFYIILKEFSRKLEIYLLEITKFILNSFQISDLFSIYLFPKKKGKIFPYLKNDLVKGR